MRYSNKVVFLSIVIIILCIFNLLPRHVEPETNVKTFEKIKPPLNKEERLKMIKAAQPNPKTRCKVTRIGCFIPQKESLVLAETTSTPSASDDFMKCARKCWENKSHLYMIFTLRKSCQCGKSIEKSYVTTSDILVKDSPSSCYRKSLYDVYRIITCTEPNDTEGNMQSLLGCYPESIHMNENIFQVPGDQTIIECLRICEHLGFILATSVKDKSCSCVTPTISAGYPQKNEMLETSMCSSDSSEQMEVMRTYLEDKRCFSKQFLQDEHPLIGLLSFPGSGSKWTRHLLETSTGIYTGSFHHDEELYLRGFLGEILEPTSERLLIAETHDYSSPDLMVSLDRIILLVRNPYNALLTAFHHDHGGEATEIQFKSQDWKNFVSTKAAEWFNTADSNFVDNVPTHVVFFENLVSNTIKEVKSILEFLEVDTRSIQQRLLCLQSDFTIDFHRYKHDGVEYFSHDLKTLVNEHITEARKALYKSKKIILPTYERY